MNKSCKRLKRLVWLQKYYVCVKMIFSTVCKNVIIHDMLLSMICYKDEGFQVNPLEAEDLPLVFSP